MTGNWPQQTRFEKSVLHFSSFPGEEIKIGRLHFYAFEKWQMHFSVNDVSVQQNIRRKRQNSCSHPFNPELRIWTAQAASPWTLQVQRKQQNMTHKHTQIRVCIRDVLGPSLTEKTEMTNKAERAWSFIESGRTGWAGIACILHSSKPRVWSVSPSLPPLRFLSSQLAQACIRRQT